MKWYGLTARGTIMSINVSLPPEFENRVREQVASGVSGSPYILLYEAGKQGITVLRELMA